jgi:pimeloyl-ACP methyl ester carboxylesterase
LADVEGPAPFEVRRPGLVLRGEETGPEGADRGAIVLAHGLTATRRYVLHRSRTLPREGYRLVAYDARGHGESDPPPADQGYDYPALAADLEAVIGERASGAAVVAGHSMGAHTAIALALRAPDRIAALVAIGPVVTGEGADAETLAYWDALADGLERGGADGFLEAYAPTLDPQWRETVLRFTRERLGAHRSPEAVARALREVPRSLPFQDMGELRKVEVPALVVGSHDDADAGHPYAVAEAWAAALPDARLVSEEPGQSPLAWQGGRLSRAIAQFCAEPAVQERLAGPTA